MNAPVNVIASHVVSAHAADADEVLRGTPRHVTADGCQFALVGTTPRAGARLTCRMGADTPVIGTVRWIVEDRIGFAFEQPLGASGLAELVSHCLQVKAIELVPVPEPNALQ